MITLSRKQGAEKAPFNKLNIKWSYLIFFVTTLFATFFPFKDLFNSFDLIIALYLPTETLSMPLNEVAFIFYWLMYSLILMLFTTIFVSIYYTLAVMFMHGMVPFSKKEFRYNMLPIISGRNIVWGLLNLLWLFKGGYFIGLARVSFELIADFIMIIFAYRYFKKYYFKKGFESRLIVALVFPFVAINIAMNLSMFIG